MKIVLREAIPADARAVSEVCLASRTAFLPFISWAHGAEAVHAWVREVLVPAGGVIVATREGSVIAMMSVRREQALSWIDQLYVAPGSTGRGVGSELVAHAKRVAGPPIQLYTFQDNLDSRRFYERHGFTPIAFGDGSLNEEHCPDILYRWA